MYGLCPMINRYKMYPNYATRSNMTKAYTWFCTTPEFTHSLHSKASQAKRSIFCFHLVLADRYYATNIIILDIIHRFVTGFCLSFYVPCTDLGPIDRAIPCLRGRYHTKTQTDSCLRKVILNKWIMSRIIRDLLTCHRHKHIRGIILWTEIIFFVRWDYNLK
jgi:hypothetical protein